MVPFIVVGLSLLQLLGVPIHNMIQLVWLDTLHGIHARLASHMKQLVVLEVTVLMLQVKDLKRQWDKEKNQIEELPPVMCSLKVI